MRITTTKLDLTQSHPELRDLTYPRFAGFLDGSGAHPDFSDQMIDLCTGVAAYNDEQPVGLALAVRSEVGNARLVSILVRTGYRRRGIGSTLLQRVETELVVRGVRYVGARFGGGQDRHAFINLMASAGWTTPVITEYRIIAPANATQRVDATWTRVLKRAASQGFSITPWFEATTADRDRAQALVDEQGENPLDFKKWEHIADPEISIAIRKHGTLVGFIIGETDVVQGHHHYPVGYVARPVQRMGWLVAGLDAVCRLQEARYGGTSTCVFRTLGDNHGMLNFVKRRLDPLSLKIHATQFVEKNLSDL